MGRGNKEKYLASIRGASRVWRASMKTILFAVGIGIAALQAPSRVNAEARPNVLVIYADDLGSVDLGCYGSEDLATPNLDRLAREGVRFTQMYSPSAICSASRAGLLTGRLPYRAGVPGNVSSQPGVAGMPSEQSTLAEIMKRGGYSTGHVGKWHLGYTPETMPNRQGFETSFGHMGGCIDNYSHFFYWAGPNRHDLWRDGVEIWRDGEFFGDLMVDEIKARINASEADPFFIYWAINFPHYPLQGTAKWREYYADLPAPRRMYNAFVSTMDEMIGEALQELERLGLRENTLILFQSDHGHSTEERTFSGGGSAGRYRGAKGCLFEGGIRVPSIVSLPGVLPENESRGQMVFGCDWAPTIAELCGIDVADLELDGKSIVPVIQSHSASSPHDHLYWRLGRGDRAQWVARKGPWKLLGNPTDRSNTAPLGEEDDLFLVNLDEDIRELTNLRDERPEIVSELMKIHEAHED